MDALTRDFRLIMPRENKILHRLFKTLSNRYDEGKDQKVFKKPQGKGTKDIYKKQPEQEHRHKKKEPLGKGIPYRSLDFGFKTLDSQAKLQEGIKGKT
jgi:hypothetical protein